jgi:hypothetical protein
MLNPPAGQEIAMINQAVLSSWPELHSTIELTM